MFRRVRLASAAALVLLACASAGYAQQPDSLTALHSGARPGRGAIGGQFGSSWILSGGDYATGAQPRLSFEGSFRYVISPHWRWQVSPYFTWNAYRTGTALNQVDPNFPTDVNKDYVLTQMVGGNGQIQVVRGKANWNWHLGAGPALYRVVVQNHRKVLKDDQTYRLHKGAYLGATAEIGVERFLRSLDNTSLEWTLAYQTAFAQRNDQFGSGFNGTPGAVELRFGGHYYFDFKTPTTKAVLPKLKH